MSANNKAYTIYDENTGEIKMNIVADESVAKANGSYIEGKYSAEEYSIHEGVPKKKDSSILQKQKTKEEWDILRLKRDILLAKSDWTQLPDSGKDKEAWAVYRSKLRDLPKNIKDPFNPKWPIEPK